MHTPRRSSRAALPAGGLLWLAASASFLIATSSAPATASEPSISVPSLIQMSGPELDALYRQGTSVGLPAGRVRGTALLAPGARRNGAMAAGTRMVWQGKNIDPANAVATNRFFGLPVVRGQLYEGASWLDGAPALILDYSKTSRVYARNRDEIRQIGPGLFLGLMYGRATPRPSLKMYFVLQVEP
ncbi:MAG: hypothetical protein P4L85_16380 [Paludisphaera borealis]|uniref:hypothetical protein n=1 Tax=Paludisphaera borealis TaxID=1387353 RepID=UPI00284ABD8C|nr:hypothetical protein [Paludisphaera borealis]MDR3620930.1 hypothetical protein [Paludisphaera borealis]